MQIEQYKENVAKLDRRIANAIVVRADAKRRLEHCASVYHDTLERDDDNDDWYWDNVMLELCEEALEMANEEIGRLSCKRETLLAHIAKLESL